MKLLIFNGSPKKELSNTSQVLKPFIRGFIDKRSNSYQLIYVYNCFLEEMSEMFLESECVLLAMPMYFSSMPSRIKELIEQIGVFGQTETNRHIGFVIQFGFPEAVHARAIEKYFKNLTERFKSSYLGTIIIGGYEGIDKESGFFNPKCSKGLYQIGQSFGRTGKFECKDLTKFSMIKENFFILNPVDRIIKKTIAHYVNKRHWDRLIRSHRMERNKMPLSKNPI